MELTLSVLRSVIDVLQQINASLQFCVLNFPRAAMLNYDVTRRNKSRNKSCVIPFRKHGSPMSATERARFNRDESSNGATHPSSG